jgi:predicted small lipoprotein YifL
MKKLTPIALSMILMLSLSGCGYDGHYRYPCQDPANWENSECKPPICTANGACPEDLAEMKEPANG